MSGGQPLLNPPVQTHLSSTWVTPGPSGQRDLNLGLTALGINQSHLGFAVLPSALVAIAHPVLGDDSNAARAVRPANATIGTPSIIDRSAIVISRSSAT